MNKKVEFEYSSTEISDKEATLEKSYWRVNCAVSRKKVGHFKRRCFAYFWRAFLESNFLGNAAKSSHLVSNFVTSGKLRKKSRISTWRKNESWHLFFSHFVSRLPNLDIPPYLPTFYFFKTKQIGLLTTLFQRNFLQRSNLRKSKKYLFYGIQTREKTMMLKSNDP